MARTSCPASIRAGQSRLPTNPEAPVTRTRMSGAFPGGRAVTPGYGADVPAPRVIACDESGYEGEHLVGGVTAVFAHAGTDLDVAEAEEVVAHLRARIRSPAQEYKANHLLRSKHRGALEWTLERMAGHASVHLVDKAFLLAETLAKIVPGESLTSSVLVAAEPVLRARTAAELATATEVLRRVAPPLADAVAQRRAAELAAPPPF